jgi:hypothetical protein
VWHVTVDMGAEEEGEGCAADLSHAAVWRSKKSAYRQRDHAASPAPQT